MHFMWLYVSIGLVRYGPCNAATLPLVTILTAVYISMLGYVSSSARA